MTDDTPVGPDPIVQTALQLLPVPEHEPTFWAALEAELAARRDAPPDEPAPPVAVEPALASGPPVRPERRTAAPHRPRPTRARRRRTAPPAPTAPTSGVLPPALRRRSNAVLAAVAVAAAAVVLLAGATLVRQRTLSGPADTAAPTADRGTTSTTARDRPADGTPERTVLSWVRALGAGDADAAWAALGPASRAHFGSRSAFDEQRAALAARYGVWAEGSPDRMIVTPVPSGGEAMLVAVTLVGTVHDGAASARRAEAIPVRLADGTAAVEPFAFAGELEIVAPGAAGRGQSLPVVSADDELVISVPRGVAAPIVRIDSGDPVVCGGESSTTLTEPADVPGQRCTYRPVGGLTPGRRVLTVAFASADGTAVSARSVLFEVA